jgi:hypothetical protein
MQIHGPILTLIFLEHIRQKEIEFFRLYKKKRLNLSLGQNNKTAVVYMADRLPDWPNEHRLNHYRKTNPFVRSTQK